MRGIWRDERGEEWLEKAIWLGFAVVAAVGAVAALGVWLVGRFQIGLQLFGG